MSQCPLTGLRRQAQLSTEAWGLSPRISRGPSGPCTIDASHGMRMPHVCTMRQGVLAGRSDKSERSHRCRPFMLTACGLPVLPQVLSAADAVTNMMKLMPPLG